jgi:predicted nucleic acid-binding protein
VIAGAVVVDASVAVEMLVDLGLAAAADRLFARVLASSAERVELWAPDLIYPEATSALRKLAMRGSIAASAGARAVRQLERLPIQATGMAPLMSDAWRLRAALTPYDACYVLLARRLSAPLVTADARLVRARARSADRVLHLADLPL